MLRTKSRFTCYGAFTISTNLLSTSAVCLGSNKLWKQKMQRERRERERLEKLNPFRRSVGLSNQLKMSGVSPQEAALEDMEISGTVHEEQDLERFIHQSDSFNRQIQRGKHAQIEPARLRKIMTMKKHFPLPKTPPLLTWIELEMIRHLHKTNPKIWTPEKLSEGFPATPRNISKILKSYPLRPNQIEEHDRNVQENWKLLAEGKLEVPEELKVHLEETGDLTLDITPEFRQHFEQEILENYEKQFEIPKLPPGEFSAILLDYQKKVEVKKAKETGQSLAKFDQVQQAKLEPRKELFDPHDNYEEREIYHIPSPKDGSALLNSGIVLAHEKYLTADQFRKKYLDKIKFSPEMSRKEQFETNPVKAKFLEWLQEERIKSSEETPIKKLSPKELEFNSTEEVIHSQKFMHFEKSDQIDRTTEERLNVIRGPPQQEKIEVPSHLVKEGSVYQVDDCFYDHNGEFLYRVPHLNEKSS